MFEAVHIYDVRFERQDILEGPFEVASCPAEVPLTYRINDVAAFNSAGGVDDGFPVPRDQVAAVFSEVPEMSETPGADAVQALRAALTGMPLEGLEVVRADVDLGDCGPQPPRIETRRVPFAEPLVTRGRVRAERSRSISTRVVTADGASLVIGPATKTYDIIDEDAFRTCFSDIVIANDQFAMFANFFRFE